MIRKTNQLNKRAKIALYLITIFAIVILITPSHIIRAIIHQQPDIDDYKLFSNRLIQAGEPQPWQLDEKYSTIALPDQLRKPLLDNRTVAFLVIQDNKIKYEEYWDGYDADSYSNSFSMSKSIVSLLIGAAIDDGKIKSIDDKVSDYLPEFKEGSKSELTIRNLLTMSAGIDFDEAYSSLFSNTTKLYYGDDLESMVNSAEVITTPGKVFDYQSINSEILAMIVESATGKNIGEYVSEKFWIPMGAENDAIWSLDKEDGMGKAFCCFNSNARDFARWGQLVLNNGAWNRKQLVSEKYINEATSSANYLLDEEGKQLDYYGLQFWIIHHNGDTIPYMRGILGQYIYAIPEKNVVVVRLGHERDNEYVGDYTKDVAEFLDAAYYILEK